MSNGTNTNSNGEGDIQFDFTKGVPDHDMISDRAMTEIVRRLQGFTGGGVSGAVVTGSTPPQDKSKLWDRGDGQVYRYDTASGDWVPTTAVPNVTEFPGISGDEGNIIEERDDGIYAIDARPRVVEAVVSTTLQGNVMRVDIDPKFDNTKYIAVIVPLHDIGESRYYETLKTTGEYQVTFVPGTGYTGDEGSTFRITLIENLNG